MKKKFVYIVLSVLCCVSVASAAFAQDLESYLRDEADTAVRVEFVPPPELVEQGTGFFSRIRSFLGIRSLKRYQPPVGTKLVVQASAYASSPYQTDSTPCITAAGTRVRPGVVATNFLPLGTLVDINGEEFIVEDRMNSRYAGYYMDVWFPSTSSALQFGRKDLNITIKGYGEPGQEIRVAQKQIEEAKQVEESGKQEEESETETSESFWGTIRTQITSLTGFLGAKSKPDPDRFDIDCLAE